MAKFILRKPPRDLKKAHPAGKKKKFQKLDFPAGRSRMHLNPLSHPDENGNHRFIRKWRNRAENATFCLAAKLHRGVSAAYARIPEYEYMK